MASYPSLIVICIGVYASVCGLGSLFIRVLHHWTGDRITGLTGPVGLALWIAIGGLLSLAGAVVPVAYVGLLLVGLAGGVWQLVDACRESPLRVWQSYQTPLAFALGIVIVLPWLVSAVSALGFNAHDDYYAYLVMPAKLLQLGTTQLDPFNYRMSVSSLGGMSFLQAGVLSLLDFENIRLIDRGVGLLVVLGILIRQLRRSGVGLLVMAGVMFGFFVVAHLSSTNITASYTAVALFMGLACLLLDGGIHRLAHVIAAGLVTGAAVTLKSTVIPPVGLMAIMAAGVLLWRHPGPWRSLLKPLAIGAAVALTVVLVWSIPRLLLDVALVRVSYGFGPEQVNPLALGRAFLEQVLWGRYALVFVVGVVAAWWHVGHVERRVSGTLTAAAILGSLAIVAATSGVEFNRYAHPYLLSAYALAGVSLLGLAQGRRVVAGVMAVGLVAGFWVFQASPGQLPFIERYKRLYPVALEALAGQQGPPLLTQVERATIRRVQQRIPAGRPVLLWVSRPFAFDFSRNPLYVMDLPCTASPPPGLPCDGSQPQLLAYLRQHDIHYVIYSYGDQAGLSSQVASSRSVPNQLNPWNRAWHHAIPGFHERLMQLARSSRRLYTNDQYVVIDLDSYPAGTDVMP